jgi:hypothetical protein
MKITSQLFEFFLFTASVLGIRIANEGLVPALVTTAIERAYARRARRRR